MCFEIRFHPFFERWTELSTSSVSDLGYWSFFFHLAEGACYILTIANQLLFKKKVASWIWNQQYIFTAVWNEWILSLCIPLIIFSTSQFSSLLNALCFSWSSYHIYILHLLPAFIIRKFFKDAFLYIYR